MGITNLCKLIHLLMKPTPKPDPFDSVFIDMQSFLYVAIEYSVEIDEKSLFDEISCKVWKELETKLNVLFPDAPSQPLTLVLSFDGEGVPMKWPIQYERRNKQSVRHLDRKAFYRYVLLGHNRLTVHVQTYLKTRLKRYFVHAGVNLEIIVCGCNIPGEGEHKLFHVTSVLNRCHHPIILSIDQDVFVLAFLRYHQFQTIQIYRYHDFYNITLLVQSHLPYPLQRLVVATFLFGNDFIPPLVSITLINGPTIHRCLQLHDDEQEDPPSLVACFLHHMSSHLKFSRVSHKDELVYHFWFTYFWILDYYSKRHFPQLYMENNIYSTFNRNSLITGLMDATYSRDAYRRALSDYASLETSPPLHPTFTQVFSDPKILNRLQPYWEVPKTSACDIIRLHSK